MRSRNGFTLLETLLTVLLLTTGSIFLLQALSLGLFSGGINETELVAVNLAQEKIESIRNTAYANIASEAKAPVGGFPFLERQVAVTVPQADLKQITVSVYYTVKDAELNITMVTYASNI